MDMSKLSAEREALRPNAEALVEEWLLPQVDTLFAKKTISPMVAEVLLEHNVKNRLPSPSAVKLYADAMKEGQWHYTHEPLLIARNRVLMNGAQRLTACINSNSNFVTDIWAGLEPSLFEWIDIGKKRNAGDLFHIDKIPHANVMAAISRMARSYDRGNIMMFYAGLRPDQVRAAYVPEMQRSSECYGWFRTRTVMDKGHVVEIKKAICPPRFMAGLHYLCSRVDEKAADEFFKAVGEGYGEGKGDPRVVLRGVIERAKNAGAPLRPEALIGQTIKAWKFWRQGKQITRQDIFHRIVDERNELGIVVQPREKMPKVED
jgi:hypothetical protein